MYRTVRGAFDGFDHNLNIQRADARAVQHIHLLARHGAELQGRHPRRDGAGLCARARRIRRNDDGDGLHPAAHATISTTVYQLWREGNEALAYKWVFVNLVISFIVLVAVNMLENSYRQPKGKAANHTIGEEFERGEER